MKIDWINWIEKTDTLIRAGKSALALEEFKEIAKLKVPNEHLVEIASLSCRAAIPQFGIKLLNPLVRSTGKKASQGTPREQAEYAYCLIRSGAEDEAFEILKTISKEVVPRVHFYEACAHINRWEYEKSIPSLEAYIKNPNTGDYDRIVAEVNLAAAYIYVRDLQKTKDLIAKIQKEAELKNHTLVHAKSMQLAAEACAMTKEWDKAKAIINELLTRFKDTAGLDNLFIRKFELRIQLETEPLSALLLNDFFLLIKEARLRGNWETVRDCDRLLAIYAKDYKRFLKVYFGTPYPTFRERLLKECPDFKLPETYDWSVSESIPNQKPELDLNQSNYGEKDRFERGTLLHQLLKALCADFYRPIRLATIHQRVYPGEFYNPRTSPHRIHRGMNRLRVWIQENRLPLEVKESMEFYSLQSDEPYTIRIGTPSTNIIRLPDAIHRLMELWPEEEFGMTEASERLGIPVRTLSRLVNKCQEEGLITKNGAGPSTRYAFVGFKKAA